MTDSDFNDSDLEFDFKIDYLDVGYESDDGTVFELRSENKYLSSPPNDQKSELNDKLENEVATRCSSPRLSSKDCQRASQLNCSSNSEDNMAKKNSDKAGAESLSVGKLDEEVNKVLDPSLQPVILLRRININKYQKSLVNGENQSERIPPTVKKKNQQDAEITSEIIETTCPSSFTLSSMIDESEISEKLNLNRKEEPLCTNKVKEKSDKYMSKESMPKDTSDISPEHETAELFVSFKEIKKDSVDDSTKSLDDSKSEKLVNAEANASSEFNKQNKTVVSLDNKMCVKLKSNCTIKNAEKKMKTVAKTSNKHTVLKRKKSATNTDLKHTQHVKKHDEMSPVNFDESPVEEMPKKSVRVEESSYETPKVEEHSSEILITKEQFSVSLTVEERYNGDLIATPQSNEGSIVELKCNEDLDEEESSESLVIKEQPSEDLTVDKNCDEESIVEEIIKQLLETVEKLPSYQDNLNLSLAMETNTTENGDTVKTKLAKINKKRAAKHKEIKKLKKLDSLNIRNIGCVDGSESVQSPKMEITVENDQKGTDNNKNVTSNANCDNFSNTTLLLNTKVDQLSLEDSDASVVKVPNNKIINICESATLKLCDSDLQISTITKFPKKSGFMCPVANLTKSERRLRKIKKCFGMSTEFRKSVKNIMKTFPKLYLMEIVRLRKLSKARISKWTSSLSSSSSSSTAQQPTFVRQKGNSNSTNEDFRQSSALIKWKARVAEEKLNKEKKRNERSCVNESSYDFASTIFNLPRIPKKREPKQVVRQIVSSTFHIPKITTATETKDNNMTKKVNSSIAKASDKLIKVSESKLSKSSNKQTPKIGKRFFEKESFKKSDLYKLNLWNDMELNSFFTTGKSIYPQLDNNSLLKDANLVKHKLAENKAFITKIPPRGAAQDVSAEYQKIISSTYDLALETEKCPEQNEINDKIKKDEVDRFSIDAQVSDDEISIKAPSVDSIIQADDNSLPVPSKVSNFHIKNKFVFTDFIRNPNGFCRSEIWDFLPNEELNETAWSNESDEIAEEVIDEIYSRNGFTKELEKYSFTELTDRFSRLLITENLPKIILIFENMQKKASGELPVQYLEQLLLVAKRIPFNLPHIAAALIKTVLHYVNLCSKENERLKLLSKLFEWLRNVEIESASETAKGNCKISLHLLSVLLGNEEFTSLIDVYNENLNKGLYRDVNDVLYLYRYGKDLHLPLRSLTIRTLVTLFSSKNLWSFCQEIYIVGCSLSVYNKIKIRRWPILLKLKSCFSEGEITIILYEFLLKLQALLRTNYLKNQGIVVDENFSIYIILEESSNKDALENKVLQSIDCTLEEVNNRLRFVLNSSLEDPSSLKKPSVPKDPSTSKELSAIQNMNVDSKRSIVTLKKDVIDKLLNSAQRWSQQYKISPFSDYDKPGSISKFPFKMLTVNALNCIYDSNPFN